VEKQAHVQGHEGSIDRQMLRRDARREVLTGSDSAERRTPDLDRTLASSSKKWHPHPTLIRPITVESI
jgi:hypothetical protein